MKEDAMLRSRSIRSWTLRFAFLASLLLAAGAGKKW
jgi:hypothetical protein